MPRAVDGTRRKERRKAILAKAKGHYGRRSTNFRVAKDSVTKAGQYAYRDRKKKKSFFRGLWIARISAACKARDINYSLFINGLTKAGVLVNRKALSNMAIEDPKGFDAFVEIAKNNLK